MSFRKDFLVVFASVAKTFVLQHLSFLIDITYHSVRISTSLVLHVDRSRWFIVGIVHYLLETEGGGNDEEWEVRQTRDLSRVSSQWLKRTSNSSSLSLS